MNRAVNGDLVVVERLEEQESSEPSEDSKRLRHGIGVSTLAPKQKQKQKQEKVELSGDRRRPGEEETGRV
eukprot:6597934-Pyramimonas_sp.AAC.1